MADVEGIQEVGAQQDQEELVYAEGGWGWIVCGAAFMVSFVVFGIHNSFGVIYSNLVEDMKMGEAETAWIGSMAGSLNFLGGPAASFLCNRYGCRPVAFIGGFLAILGLFLTSFVQETAKMYVTYGLLWGVGSSFSFIPSIVVLGQYFHHRFPLVNGIASSGSGIGGLLAAPFINFILSTVGWQNSMRILACFAVLLLLSSSVYQPVKRQVNLRGESNIRAPEATIPVPSVWRCKSYIVLVVAVALFQFCYPVPFMHLVQFSKTKGVPQSRGSWLLGILSITATTSKIIFGKISELQCINRRYLFQLAIFSMGLGVALCPLANSYAGILCFSIAYGLFDGCFVGQLNVVTSDIVGHERLSQAVGNMYGVIAVPLSFGPPVAAWLYKAFGSYDSAFFVAGGAAILTSLLLFLIPILSRKERPLHAAINSTARDGRPSVRTRTALGTQSQSKSKSHSRYLKSGAKITTISRHREARSRTEIHQEIDRRLDESLLIANADLPERETVL